MITGENQAVENKEQVNEFETQVSSDSSSTQTTSNPSDESNSQPETSTNNTNTETNINSDSEKVKYSEFNYSNIPKREDTAKVKIPMTWQKQTLISVSTTIIGSLPLILKMYNNKKDPSMPEVTFSDVVDVVVYKFPDLYALILKLTKDGPFEKIATKAKILFILAPLLGTIKALFKHNEMVQKHGFDYMLFAHIFAFVVNTLIPFIVMNPTLNYAYNTLMKGSIFNLAVGTLMRSNNPMAREVGKTIPALAVLLDKFKFLSSAAKNEFLPNQQQNPQMMNNGGYGYGNSQIQQQNPNNPGNVIGKGIIDFVTGMFANNSNNYYGGNYYNNRGYGGNQNNGNGLWI